MTKKVFSPEGEEIDTRTMESISDEKHVDGFLEANKEFITELSTMLETKLPRQLEALWDFILELERRLSVIRKLVARADTILYNEEARQAIKLTQQVREASVKINASEREMVIRAEVMAEREVRDRMKALQLGLEKKLEIGQRLLEYCQMTKTEVQITGRWDNA